MSRNKSNLKHQMMKKLDSLARIGSSKHIEQLKNKADGRGYKSDYIHSIRTLELYKDESSRFCAWLKENGYSFKSLSSIPRDVVGDYIKSRNGLSAWTSHLTLAAMNKLTGFNFTTHELGLKSRRIDDIHNNRGFSSSRRADELKYADAINFIRCCGCRRSSVDKVNYNNFKFGVDGKIESVYVVEKGGKSHYYYVLPEYRDWLTTYIKDYYSSVSHLTPLFIEFDKNRHINTHWYRNEYSCSLYAQLLDELHSSTSYFGGSDYLNYAINSRKVSANFKKHGDTYKSYDVMVLSLLSQALSHFRLDVVVNHYLRFDCC